MVVTVPLVLIAIGLVILSVMRYMQKPEKVIKKFEWLRTFYIWLGALAILGGTWAFFLPIALNSGFNKDDDGPVLRQLLIYTVGGLLGVITLGETHRKNNLEKDKNDQDHIRQVHAERRNRYTKAIEYIFNENISSRLSGVYTLASLADEWLSDEKTLHNKEERRKEGQVIINTLCSYIRSSFILSSKAELLAKDETPRNYEGGEQQFIKDQTKFREEKELRLTILEAIKTRLNERNRYGFQTFSKCSWSDFDYDFSNAHFFYPIGFTDSYFGASSKFAGATFTENADFSEAEFTNADFIRATFTQDAKFSGGKFTRIANFSEAEFTNANFSEAEFTNANFSEAEFTQNANFSKAEFTQNANFSKAEFTKDAKFSGAEFTNANFSEAAFTQNANFSGAAFTQNANFSEAAFTQNAKFSGAAFTQNANFSGAAFTQNANFSWGKFTNADFLRATFTQDANFLGASFENIPNFGKTRGFGLGITYAKFSCKANPEDYNFKVSHNSPYKIETKEQEHNGIKFVIPKDAELFDPDEPSE